MENFKKNTIALILLLAFTIAGCFATETYKNSIMAIDLEAGTNGAVTMVIQTKKPYSSSINLVKKDAVTYVMMLPEFDSSASTPNLAKVTNISSVDVQTRPYVSDNNGYTKITIKTNGNALIFPQYKVYMPKAHSSSLPDNAILNRYSETNQQAKMPEQRSMNRKSADKTIKDTKRTASSQQTAKDKNIQTTSSSADNNTKTKIEQNTEKTVEVEPQSSSNTQSTVQIPENTVDNSVSIWSVIVLICSVIGSVILLIVGKNKMAEVVGNSIDITIHDDENNKVKSQNTKQVKQPSVTTHKSVPKQNFKPLLKQNYNSGKKSIPIKENSLEQVIVEKMNVIDMDELFNSQKSDSSKQPEKDTKNEALEDFLNNYYDEEQKTRNNDSELIDESTYNDILGNKKLKFSSKDITKINALMETEITEDVKQMLREKSITNPIPESKQIYSFENIIADYCIKQNIIFNSEDIKIIHKLMSVELDQDFITDLRTKQSSNTSVSTISKNEQKEDALTGAESNICHSSVVQVGEYNVAVLKIEDELPDLQDVLAHPENYEDSEPEDVAVDENALLQSLSNVQFKPFYTEENQITDSDSTEYQTENDNEMSNILENSHNDPLLQEANLAISIPNSNETSNINKNVHKILPQQFSNSLLVDGVYYDILSTAYFNKDAGVYLTKAEDLYVIFGFIGKKIQKLKAYNSLKSEKIIIRISETFDNGTIRYLVKMGLKKFIIDYNENNITYVMDLC